MDFALHNYYCFGFRFIFRWLYVLVIWAIKFCILLLLSVTTWLILYHSCVRATFVFHWFLLKCLCRYNKNFWRSLRCLAVHKRFSIYCFLRMSDRFQLFPYCRFVCWLRIDFYLELICLWSKCIIKISNRYFCHFDLAVWFLGRRSGWKRHAHQFSLFLFKHISRIFLIVSFRINGNLGNFSGRYLINKKFIFCLWLFVVAFKHRSPILLFWNRVRDMDFNFWLNKPLCLCLAFSWPQPLWLLVKLILQAQSLLCSFFGIGNDLTHLKGHLVLILGRFLLRYCTTGRFLQEKKRLDLKSRCFFKHARLLGFHWLCIS